MSQPLADGLEQPAADRHHERERWLGFVRFVASRLAVALISVWAVSVLTFLALQATPGSYEDVVLGPGASDEQREEVRERLGLDRPAALQYFYWLRSALAGDLGTSFNSGEPVIQELAQRVPVTLELGFLAIILIALVGYPLGILAARRDGRLFTPLARGLGPLALGIPEFISASILVFVFSRYDLWFTIGPHVPFGEDPVTNLRTALPPAFAIALMGIGFVATTTRQAATSVLAEPYVDAAAARGETRRQIVRRHVLRNSGGLSITSFAVVASQAITGTVIVETIFSQPGVGRYIVQSVIQRDYPVVQGGVLFISIVFIAVGLLLDLCYAVIDPRVAAKSGGK